MFFGVCCENVMATLFHIYMPPCDKFTASENGTFCLDDGGGGIFFTRCQREKIKQPFTERKNYQNADSYKELEKEERMCTLTHLQISIVLCQNFSERKL